MKILVAEDNEMIRSQYHRSLSEAGHDVHVTRDGREALEAYRIFRPFDVLITDRDMPNMNGLQLLDSLHNEPIDYRFLIASDDQNGMRDQAAELGAEFIPKPFSFRQLVQKLKALYPE